MRGMARSTLVGAVPFVAIPAGIKDTVAATGILSSGKVEHMVVFADEAEDNDSDTVMDRNGDSACDANDVTEADTLASRA